MRVFKKVLTGLVAVIAILWAVSFAFPRNVEVSRSMVIDAPAQEIFSHVSSLQAMSEWSPWLGRDPETRITYSGAQGAVGSAMEWSSDHPQVGSGRQEIIELMRNQRVVIALDFGAQGTATASFHLKEANGQTTVTWDMQADMGSNPIGRYMGLMMDRWVGADYERGLSNLQRLVGGSS